MSLLSVEAALKEIVTGVAPLSSQIVALADADGRVLSDDLTARLTQPPFDASAMDGYAVRRSDVAELPATLSVVGHSAAGRGFAGAIGPDQAVRIFTGAPVPQGSDAIVIQENAAQTSETASLDTEAQSVTVVDGTPDPGHIRKRGFDFKQGESLIAAGTRLGPRTLTLAAAMGHSEVTVVRRPRVAILATGDELVWPGTLPEPDQIVCSNAFGVAAIIRRAGAEPVLLGIAPDDRDRLADLVTSASQCDVVVTIGGASVGDHDLVGPVLAELGVTLAFWKIAMRPGKPLMFGRTPTTRYVGLPGNPVSSLVCAFVFVAPLIRALLGQPFGSGTFQQAHATVPLGRNGPRRHYMRATLGRDDRGRLSATPVRSQDSSLLTLLACADAFIVREPEAEPVNAGDQVKIMNIDF